MIFYGGVPIVCSHRLAYEFDELKGRVENALENEEDTVKAVRATIAAFLTYFEERMDFFRAAIACREKALQDDVEFIQDKATIRLGEIGGMLGEKLAEGREGGVIKGYDSRFLGFLLMGIVHYYEVYVVKFGSGQGLTDAAEMLSDIYLDGVRTTESARSEEQ
jgi:hypothetical protein